MSCPTETPTWSLEWTDELSVCIPEIDVEHQRFAHLVNQLNEAIVRRMDMAEIQRRMQAILDDAVAHFEHEERLFREWGYPDAEAHAQKHAQAVEYLGKIMEGFGKEGTEYEWIEAGLKVKQTLIEHLLHEDMKYRDYVLRNRLCKC
ncbi:MAG: hemerythrin domain-containing protein [Nitrosomonadales bacterium]|nr:hemerythrin domain-containing protein [Nitrosomonadales bacterium]